MKRSEALTSLSHEHHQALTIALRLRRSEPETAAADRAEFLRFWDGHEHHFEIEERVLLPAFERHAPDQPLVRRVRNDHAELRSRAAAIAAEKDADPESLAEFGELFKTHVRMEERELFPLIEKSLPPDDLATLAQQLEDADPGPGGRVQIRP